MSQSEQHPFGTDPRSVPECTSAPDITQFCKDSGDVSGRVDMWISTVAGDVTVRVSLAS